MCCVHEAQALAVQPALIRALDPPCNRADLQLRMKGASHLRSERVTPLGRPHKRFRLPEKKTKQNLSSHSKFKDQQDKI